MYKKYIIYIVFFIFISAYQVSAQPFTLNNIPQHSAAFSVAANCTATISSSGAGTQQWQGSSIGTNGLYGTGGSVAASCSNQTGLRLEMSGAGNGSGTGAWNNSITVTFTFPQGVKGPLTFNVFDITEDIYYDGSYNYAYYQDKLTISSSKCDGTLITPTLTANNGPITSATVGSSLVLTANKLQGQCKNEPISIGTATDLIKTVTIVYANQDPPNNLPAPVGSPPRYGVSQYQYAFISTINATPPDPITVTATPNPICTGQTVTLTAASPTAYNYSWASGTTPTTGTPVTATPAATTTYTVTGTIGTCTQTNSTTVTVSSGITPAFTPIAPICTGAVLTALPTTSTNGITGTWSPALNNTTTTTYTFTPAAGQCAVTTTLTISVGPPVTPTFAAVAPKCSGSVIAALPTTSTNGVTGTWSPAINNTATTLYTFTPTAGLCATTTTLTITVNPNTIPTFTAVAPICSGVALAALPTTSTNGITGTWSPAINNTVTTLYTFTPTAGLCATSTTLTITVNPNTTPTFAAVAPICSGAALAALPTTSTNGITGTWSPALNNTATTLYTFTPTAGLCATTPTLTITVNPNTTPTFAAVAPICSGAALTALPTTSTNGITGTWSPTINNTATTLYTFTPNAGQCATTTTLTITVNSTTVTPTFSVVAPICSGAALSALPTTSTNAITGSWSPALNNTATTVYTFTPNAGQCATTSTLTITVNSNVTPTFAAVAPICNGAALSALPTTSTNGITGNWSPALDNTTTTLYTFTPTAGQCAVTTTVTISVGPPATPTFAPVAPICSGGALAALPITSTNAITGTWSPAINNTATTLYTFTPTAGLCATTSTLSITVNPNITPTFAAVAPICSGDALAALPTTSTNGITGTWSPAINNTATTLYTFTPTAGLCATTTTLSVTVNSPVTPTFAAISPICSGSALAVLPTTSTNAITGTWSPAINNTTTTLYTFTPTLGLCATTTTLTITVNPNITPTFAAVSPICSGTSSADLQTTSTNGVTGTWSPAINNTSTTLYTFTPNVGQCASTTTLTITVNPQPVLVITDPTPVCAPSTVDLTAFTVTFGSSGGGILSYWTNPLATNPLSNPSIVSNSATYYIQTTTAAGCKEIKPVTVLINTVPMLTITNPNTVCFPNTVNITASSVSAGSIGGGLYTYWNDVNATSLLSSPTAITTSGTYYIQTITAAGCKDIEPVTVIIEPSPTSLFNSDITSGCSPVCVNFTDVSTLSSGTITNWNWNFGGTSTSNLQNPKNCFTNPGQHNVTLSVTTSNGCTAVSSPTIITVLQSPIAEFNPYPNPISMFDSIVTMNNQSSSDVNYWYWDFGDGTILSPNISYPTHAYPNGMNTSYLITLIVQNANGCYATIVHEISVIPEFTFYIPNTFSPDDDGDNDTFYGKGVGILEYELTIYDRWGMLIFTANELNEAWDGKVNDGADIAQQDVYVWKVTLQDVFLKTHDYIGTVTIIK